MEQLQQTLNEAKLYGWKYLPFTYDHTVGHIVCTDAYVIYHNSTTHGPTFSYHELFSKDSGLMEFMQWDNVYVDHDLKLDNDYIQGTDPQYHYMIMGPMSATDKINYFNTNAYLQGKQ